MKKAALSLALIAVSLSAQAENFSVTSNDMPERKTLQIQQVFNGFGCEGGNQSPQLSWQGAPAGTKSFAVTAYDPDAPTGSGWWHWTVVNIPADTHQLATNAGQRTDIASTTKSTTKCVAPVPAMVRCVGRRTGHNDVFMCSSGRQYPPGLG
ncbi:YbhB/YbcL family Raf kinase inhibitor-like protein [Yersinia kristensenii]|uniref:YbhB/YbcL family Raf kinase inhibitor-like protein n=1 Tax=Yersinia kristensenii TaxID=28152 RepID=UPI003896C452